LHTPFCLLDFDNNIHDRGPTFVKLLEIQNLNPFKKGSPPQDPVD